MQTSEVAVLLMSFAKEAAEEAKLIPEDSQILTEVDFKKLARVSCCMKWQRSWDASDTGRTL